MFNFSDPETLWLNVTNIALGAVTLVCLIVLGRAIILEVVARARKRSVAIAEDAGHSLFVSELGLTMADGGEQMKQDGEGTRDGSKPADGK